MRLQLALDAPEHLALVPRLAAYFDIVEVGTPLLKRFGIGAVATARELSGGLPVLADTKTVDGGALEARMVLGAGAVMMTVLAVASPATRRATLDVAAGFGADVVFDTLASRDPVADAPDEVPSATGRWIGLHSSHDARSAGDRADVHIRRVADMRAGGYAVVLAGGLGPDNFASVLDAGPEIAVIGSSVTEAARPEVVAAWLRTALDRAG